MTTFCKTFSSGSRGEYGDCGLFVVNGLGFVIIFSLLVAMPLLHAKNNKKPVILSTGQDVNQTLKHFALSSQYDKKIFAVKAFYCLMIVIASLVFAFSILEAVNGYACVANYISVFLRTGGWLLLSFYAQEFIARRNRFLVGALCWGTSQVATAGMSSIHYQLDQDVVLLSTCGVLYFIMTCLYVVAVILQIIHETERFDISNPLLYCNRSSADDVVNDRAVDREAMNSLYIKQQRKQKVSYDAPSSASYINNDDNESVTSSIFSSSQCPPHPGGLQRTASLRSVDLSSDKNHTPTRPYSTSRVSPASSKWSLLRGQFRTSSGFGFGQPDVTIRILDWEFFVLNEKNRIALYRLELQEQDPGKHSLLGGMGGEAGGGFSQVVTKRHDELLFLHEKLSDCFPNITLPRVPVPPLLFSQQVGGANAKEDGQSNVEFTKLMYGNIAYNLHQQEMQVFLSALLTHEIVGQRAYAELREGDSRACSSTSSRRFLDTRLLSTPHPSSSSSKILNLRESQVSIDDSWEVTSTASSRHVAGSPAVIATDIKKSVLQSDAAGPLCLEVPPFGHLQAQTQAQQQRGGGGCSVRVTGVIEGEALKGSSDKLFFLIEVVTPLPSSSPVLPSSSDVSAHEQQAQQKRTVKKKFKQLLTLNNILLKSPQPHIVEIAKSFPTLSRKVEGGEEHKLSKNEMVRELDQYIVAMYTSRNPHTTLLFSFLESDIHECTSGFDFVFRLNGIGRGDGSTSGRHCPPSIIGTIDTDTKSFKQRMKDGHLRNKLFCVNDGKVLSETAPALNSLGANWVEELNKANEILDTFGSDQKLKTKEKRSTVTTRDASSFLVGAPELSGFSSPSNSSITAIVSDSLAKLALLVHHVGGVENHVQPYQEDDPTEFLVRREVSVLNWRSTAHTSEPRSSSGTGASGMEKEVGEVVGTDEVGGIGEAYAPDTCGVWLAQWRLRRAVASSTAFSEISIEVSNLKNLPVKQLKKASNAEKLSFLINLYNLISLHATILLPWPASSDTLGRCRWQAQARYQVGDVCLSLLQIEHALLRSRLVSRPLPTIPHCPSVPVPSPADIKHLSSLLPKTVDVRALMALALPFRSSSLCYLYLSSVPDQVSDASSSSDTDHASLSMQTLQRELFQLVSEHLVSRLAVYSVESKVLVPKVLRRYLEDILLFRKNYDKVGVSASPPLHNIQFSDTFAHRESLSSHGGGGGGGLERVASSQTFSQSGSAMEDTCSVQRRSGSGSGSGHETDRSHIIDINHALKMWKDCLKPSSATSTSLGSSREDSLLGDHQQSSSFSQHVVDMEGGGGETRSGWELAAGLDAGGQRLPPPQAQSSLVQRFSQPCFGDKMIAESEFQQLRQILASELKIKNRKFHFKTYNNCFLGSDAVNCLSSYIPGGSQTEAVAVGNQLCEYGVIRHVVDEHWLKPKDNLFYTLGNTSTSGSGRQMTPLLSFLRHHISGGSSEEGGGAFTRLSHQISSADDLSFSVLYLPEDFRFKVPLKMIPMHK